MRGSRLPAREAPNEEVDEGTDSAREPSSGREYRVQWNLVHRPVFQDGDEAALAEALRDCEVRYCGDARAGEDEVASYARAVDGEARVETEDGSEEEL